jgi:predicted DCC family thiol-disulfide oxidoreductase YuxK
MGTPASIEGIDRPVILFDGVCNLCNGAVQFIINRDSSGKFLFASLQSPFAKNALQNFFIAPDSLYSIILVKDGRLYDRSDALLQIARDLDGIWSALYIFRFVPRVLRDATYKLIANNRYKIFGRADACMMPTRELRARFLG